MDAEGTARSDQLRRTERILARVRWGGALFALLQVWAYDALPYPPGHREAAFALVGALVLANVVVALVLPRCRDLRSLRALSLSMLTADVLVVLGFVTVYAFDPDSAHWAILFVLPLEGAARFDLGGALATWAAVAVGHVLRQVYAEARFGLEVNLSSTAFRMGLVLLVAAVAGFMARDGTRQRADAERALRELERIDALRGRLVSALAHDVRSPLTAIRGSLQVVRTRPGLDEGSRATLLAIADRQAERLQRLAADLLDLARLDEGKLALRLDDVPLRDVLEGATAFLDPDGALEVDVSRDVEVRADRERLEQVLVNLVGNALTHGLPPVELRARRDGPHIVLEIRDHGPGVPPEDVPRMFEPFAAGTARGSVGLGLWIVGALVDAHGGVVRYEAPEDGGARFVVVLPAASHRLEAEALSRHIAEVEGSTAAARAPR